MVRVLCLCCVEAALWFLLVALAVGFCNGPPGGVVVVRHGADMDSAIVTAIPAAVNLWRVAAVALAAVVARRGTKFLASALPPREGAAGAAAPTGTS